ncbi:transcriptional regulator [Methylobacterium radiotolerans]|uniref:transcriptional regulator n=1 Tax=Methylobacterium radiotolerans TaxID=31998 RepID=UPI0038D0D280
MTGLISAETVRAQLAEQCRAAGSQKAWAERAGVSQAYLCDVLKGNREPGESILAAMGLVRVVAYRVAN